MKSPEQRSTLHAPRPTFLWWATFVLLVTAVFRLIALQDVPPGLAQDEVLNADIVTFIQQGKHALFFREGYGHEPLYHYWSLPFRPLLGDNLLSIRLPAVYLGLLLVAVTMRWLRRDFGGVTAVVAGMGLAISWWPIIFSRIGLRPILEPLLLVLMVWFWPRRPWLAGVFLGLSFYSYTAATVAFLIPLLFTGYLLFTRRQSPTTNYQLPITDYRLLFTNLRSPILILVIALLLYLPLGLTLRADPTLLQRAEQLEGPLLALQNGDVRPVLQTTLATLGVFSFTGDPRWTYTLPGRPFFDPVTAVLFYAGLLLAFTRLRQPRYALILIWLGVGLLPSALTPQAPSTVRLVGAMPVVYLLPGLAVGWMWRKVIGYWLVVSGRRFPIPDSRFPIPGYWLLVTGYWLLVTGYWLLVTGYWLLITAVFALNVFLTVRDGFLRWPAELETRFKYQTVWLDMGRHWRDDPAASLVVVDGFFEPIDADSFRRNLGYDPGARWVQTGAGMAGAIVLPRESQGVGNGRLYVPESAPPHSALLAAAGVSPEPVYRSQAKPSFAVYGLPAVLPMPTIPVHVVFDDAITLLGYEILPLQTERPLQLFTYWQVEAPLPWDLAIFVHLLDENGGVVSQHDGLDAAATMLQPGDVFVQRHLLPLPDNMLENVYTLQLGLYTRGNGRRLTHPGEPADRVILELFPINN